LASLKISRIGKATALSDLEADDDPASTCKNQCAKAAPAAQQFASPCRYTHR
jgi:hypothetical protein